MALMSSPASKGLFGAAISLSGSPNITMTLDVAEQQNADVIKLVGCEFQPTEAAKLECLRNTPAYILLAAIPPSMFTPGIWYVYMYMYTT